MDRPKLLVIDDDSYTRLAMRSLFSRKGWQVGEAATVAEGLSRLDSAPLCIILDLNLPDGGGERVLREVRNRLPGTFVAVCSGSTDPIQLAEVRDLHPELMLSKPVDIGPIEQLCRTVLAG